jgi:4'-phosphopantetheinyl transferase
MLRWLVRGEDALPDDLRWLTLDETARVQAMRFAKRRTESLLRRLAAKQAVAATLGFGGGFDATADTLARIEVRHDATGAPFVLLDGASCDLAISISDRAGWAIAMTGPGALGCDLELVEPRSPGFVRQFLTGPERLYVESRPDTQARAVATNLLWSAKESALKVRRTGLRQDARDLDVTIHDGQPGDWAALAVRCVDGTACPGWWRRDGRYLVTVAAAAPTPPPVALEDPAALTAAEPRHSWLARPLVAGPARRRPRRP